MFCGGGGAGGVGAHHSWQRWRFRECLQTSSWHSRTMGAPEALRPPATQMLHARGAPDARLLGALHAAGCIRRTPSAWQFWANKVCALGTERRSVRCTSDELTDPPHCVCRQGDGGQMGTKLPVLHLFYHFHGGDYHRQQVLAQDQATEGNHRQASSKGGAAQGGATYPDSRAHTRRPTYARACTQEHAHVCLITIIPLPPFSPFAGKKEKKLALNPKS